ncbi:MAK10-like protein [Tanacetum coccineum]
MGDENPIRTLGDYSKPSHEGYRNTIELHEGNNVVPLRSDTIRLVQNGCSFHGLWSEDPNQHLKDFLKLVDSLDLGVANRERTRLRLFQFFLRDQASNWLEHLRAGFISTWEDLTTRFLAQFFPPERTAKLRNNILNGKLRVKNNDESWEIIENLALYDHEGCNDSKDFVKPVKAISTSRNTLKTPDRRLLELEDQINFLLKDPWRAAKAEFLRFSKSYSSKPLAPSTRNQFRGSSTRQHGNTHRKDGKEEKTVEYNGPVDKGIVEPGKSDEEEPPKEVNMKNEVERKADDKPAKSTEENVTKNEEDEPAEASSSQL